MLIYAVISTLKIKRQVRASVRRSDGVYVCDEVRSPFILGVIRPRIYLPSDTDEKGVYAEGVRITVTD